MKIRRKLEEIRVVLINSNFSEIRSSEFADAAVEAAARLVSSRSNQEGVTVWRLNRVAAVTATRLVSPGFGNRNVPVLISNGVAAVSPTRLLSSGLD